MSKVSEQTKAKLRRRAEERSAKISLSNRLSYHLQMLYEQEVKIMNLLDERNGKPITPSAGRREESVIEHELRLAIRYRNEVFQQVFNQGRDCSKAVRERYIDSIVPHELRSWGEQPSRSQVRHLTYPISFAVYPYRYI